MGHIDRDALTSLAAPLMKSEYGRYLMRIATETRRTW
jgi:hypothetical protein